MDEQFLFFKDLCDPLWSFDVYEDFLNRLYCIVQQCCQENDFTLDTLPFIYFSQCVEMAESSFFPVSD